jgi:hypothetical protein
VAGPGLRAGRAPEPEEYEDYARLAAAELAEISQAAADELLAVEAATTGRRGPGQPGSTRVFPGESSSPAAAFGPGTALDVLPGCAGLAAAADAAAGEDGGFAGVSEGELIGVMCAWDRVEAHAAARKLVVAAELIRRNPKPGCEPEGPARMPAAWDEFATDQVAYALAESRDRAGSVLDLAQALETRLPGTKAALLDGTITRYKAELITRATSLLDDAEAAAAEAEVLDRAGRLTPGGLRAAIARAVMESPRRKQGNGGRPRRRMRGWSGGSRIPGMPQGPRDRLGGRGRPEGPGPRAPRR